MHGSFLFTHRGYSGPAVLDISSTPDSMRVSWGNINQDAWEDVLTNGSGLIVNAMAEKIPRRLVERLLVEAGVPADRRFQDLRRTERIALIELLTAYPLKISGNEGYKKAEVTGGGVALDEVDAATLESKRVPGIFFCGEILDAYGPIGGHNFAWAWSTGRAAGLGARGTVPFSTGFPQ